MVRLSLVVALVAFASCRTENPDYCPANPGEQGCPDAPTVGGSCQMDQDCTRPNLKVCDTSLNGGMCVLCSSTEHDACQNPTPACTNNACQKCTLHSQCSSSVCLPDGTCADAGQVAYVQPDGSGTTCTQASPCKTLDDAVKTMRPIAKLKGTVTSDKMTTIDGKAVQIYADPGAKLTRSTPGTILEVKNDPADVRIYALEITGGSGMKTDSTISLSGGTNPKLTLTHVNVHDNVGQGIVATKGTLNVSQSTISSNSGGGIAIGGSQFDVTNNFITSNGGPANGGPTSATTFGGVFIDPLNSGTQRLEFNTVTKNSAFAVTGVVCTSTSASATLSNNIVYNNSPGTGISQVGGTSCSWTYSDIGDTVIGTGNMVADPMFIDPTIGNFHLTAASPIKDLADPTATLTIDFDSDTRPQNGRCDIGADEIVPGK